MRRRWLSLLLALSLALSLAVPVLAEEPEEEQPVLISAPADEEWEDGYASEFDRGWSEGYDAGQAEGYAKGVADLQAGAPCQEQDGDAPESDADDYDAGYAEGYFYGLQDGYNAGYYSEYQRGWDEGYEATYQQGYDAGAAAALAAAPVLPASREIGEDSADYGQGLADGRIDGYEDGYHNGYYDTCGRAVYADLEVAEKGGVPGQINVMWQGACVKFDVAPQVKDQRTMVPVRFLAEASGYTVLWDQDHKTAVIVDEASRIAEIDSRFTAINELMAVRLKEEMGKKTESSYTIKGSLTVYDEAGKATDVPFSARLESRTNGLASRVDVSLDVRNAILALAGKGMPLEDVQVKLRTALTTDWSDLRFSLILDEAGGIYMNSPLLSLLDEDAFGGLGENAWVELGSLAELGAPLTGMTGLSGGLTGGLSLASIREEGLTVGRLMMMTGILEADPFNGDEILDTAVAVTEAILGDSQVQRTGDRYTWTADLNAVMAAAGLGQEELKEIADAMKMDMTLSADRKGAYSVDLDLSLSLMEGMGPITLGMKASGNETSGTLSLQAGMEGVLSLTLDARGTARTVGNMAPVALPAGAEIVRMDSLTEE